MHVIKLKSRRARWLAIFVLPIFSGCLLVPFVDAFKQAGATEGDRMALLGPEVKKFTDAVTWGKRSEALSHVLDESRKELSIQLKQVGEDEHVVESKIEDVEWLDSARDATVSVKVRYYMVPYYIVKNRIEEQDWTFSLSSGWKLKSRKIVDG